MAAAQLMMAADKAVVTLRPSHGCNQAHSTAIVEPTSKTHYRKSPEHKVPTSQHFLKVSEIFKHHFRLIFTGNSIVHPSSED